MLDTVIMVSAIRSNFGASRKILLAAFEGRFSCLVSVPLMIEYQAVMTTPEHLAAARLSGGDVGRLLDAFATIVEPVHLDFSWRPATPDPNDDMVLETAVNGRADAIVTFNIRDFQSAVGQFGIDLVRPADVVKQLETTR